MDDGRASLLPSPAGMLSRARRTGATVAAASPASLAILELAAAAMEERDFEGGLGLLVPLLDGSVTEEQPGVEATARALMAQALFELGDTEAGLAQAEAALEAAGRTNQRALIHGCMALVETFRVLRKDAL